MVVGADKVFVSDSVASGIQASAKQSIDFGSQGSVSKFMFTSGTYAENGAGWYAVPEPTSGLLLLIGMAGLALKRKRA